MAIAGHSLGKLAMSHGPLASWVEVLAMASDEGGHLSPYVGELWDAASEGSSESVSAMNHGVQISRVEFRAMIQGGRGRCPLTPVKS